MSPIVAALSALAEDLTAAAARAVQDQQAAQKLAEEAWGRYRARVADHAAQMERNDLKADAAAEGRAP